MAAIILTDAHRASLARLTTDVGKDPKLQQRLLIDANRVLKEYNLSDIMARLPGTTEQLIMDLHVPPPRTPGQPLTAIFGIHLHIDAHGGHTDWTPVHVDGPGWHIDA
jgi:hypothetical protein